MEPFMNNHTIVETDKCTNLDQQSSVGSHILSSSTVSETFPENFMEENCAPGNDHHYDDLGKSENFVAHMNTFNSSFHTNVSLQEYIKTLGETKYSETVKTACNVTSEDISITNNEMATSRYQSLTNEIGPNNDPHVEYSNVLHDEKITVGQHSEAFGPVITDFDSTNHYGEEIIFSEGSYEPTSSGLHIPQNQTMHQPDIVSEPPHDLIHSELEPETQQITTIGENVQLVQSEIETTSYHDAYSSNFDQEIETSYQDVPSDYGQFQAEKVTTSKPYKRQYIEDTESEDDLDDMSYELKQGFRILQEVMSESHKNVNWPFLNSVDPERDGVPDYFDKVPKPMWLKKMKENFTFRNYISITEFVGDFRLMLENCYRYNGPDHNISKKGQRLETILEQKLSLLSRDLREKTSIEATSGKKVEQRIVSGTRRRKALVPHDSTALLNQLRLEKQERLKEQRRLQMQQKKEEHEKFVQQLDEWEDTMFGEGGKDLMRASWEIPQIGQMLYCCCEVLNLEEVMHWQLERSFFMPRESRTMQRVMTSLLSTPYQRTRLEGKPLMPYRVWEEKLRVRVRQWYKTYKENPTNYIKTFSKTGIEEMFFKVVGHTNPLERRKYHELSAYQRIWMLKALCDSCVESQESLREAIDSCSYQDTHEYVLGEDAQGYTYIHFPQFCGNDVRVYKCCPVKMPTFDKPTPSKKKSRSPVKKSRRRAPPKKVTPPPTPPPRPRDSRLRQRGGRGGASAVTSTDSSCEESSTDSDTDSGISDSEQPLPSKHPKVESSSKPTTPRNTPTQRNIGTRRGTTARGQLTPDPCRDITPTRMTRSLRRKGYVLDEDLATLSRDSTPGDMSRESTPDSVSLRKSRKHGRFAKATQNLTFDDTSSRAETNDSNSVDFDMIDRFRRRCQEDTPASSRCQDDTPGSSRFQDDTPVSSRFQDDTPASSNRTSPIDTCDNKFTPIDIPRVAKETDSISYSVDNGSDKCSSVTGDNISRSPSVCSKISYEYENSSDKPEISNNKVSSDRNTPMEIDETDSKISTPVPFGSYQNEKPAVSLRDSCDKVCDIPSGDKYDCKKSDCQNYEKDNHYEQKSGETDVFKQTEELSGSSVAMETESSQDTKSSSSSVEIKQEGEQKPEIKQETVEDKPTMTNDGHTDSDKLSGKTLPGDSEVKQEACEEETKIKMETDVEAGDNKSQVELGENDIKSENVGDENAVKTEVKEEKEVVLEEEIPPEITEPDLSEFELVVEDVDGLRELTAKFEEQPFIPPENTRNKKAIVEPPKRKQCEIDLYERLAYLLKELGPWEQKLVAANKRARIALKREHMEYVEPPPVEDVWESEESSSETSDSDKESSVTGADEDHKGREQVEEYSETGRPIRSAAKKMIKRSEEAAKSGKPPLRKRKGDEAKDGVIEKKSELVNPAILSKKPRLAPSPTGNVQYVDTSGRPVQLSMVNGQPVLIRGPPSKLQPNTQASKNSALIAQLMGNQTSNAPVASVANQTPTVASANSSLPQLPPQLASTNLQTQMLIRKILSTGKAVTMTTPDGKSYAIYPSGMKPPVTAATAKPNVVATNSTDGSEQRKPKSAEYYKYNSASDLPDNVLQDMIQKQNEQIQHSASSQPTALKNLQSQGALNMLVSDKNAGANALLNLKSNFEVSPEQQITPISNNDSSAQPISSPQLSPKPVASSPSKPQALQPTRNVLPGALAAQIQSYSAASRKTKYDANLTVKQLLQNRSLAAQKAQGQSEDEIKNKDESQGQNMQGQIADPDELSFRAQNDPQSYNIQGHPSVYNGEGNSKVHQIQTDISVASNSAHALDTVFPVSRVTDSVKSIVSMEKPSTVPMQSDIIIQDDTQQHQQHSIVVGQDQLVNLIKVDKSGTQKLVQKVQVKINNSKKPVVLNAEKLQKLIMRKQVVDEAVKRVVTEAPTTLPTAQIKVSSPFAMPSRQPHRPVTTTTLAMKAPIPAVPNLPTSGIECSSSSCVSASGMISTSQPVVNTQVVQTPRSKAYTKVCAATSGPIVQDKETLSPTKCDSQNVKNTIGTINSSGLKPSVVVKVSGASGHVPAQVLQKVIAAPNQGLTILQQGDKTLQNVQKTVPNVLGNGPSFSQTKFINDTEINLSRNIHQSREAVDEMDADLRADAAAALMQMSGMPTDRPKVSPNRLEMSAKLPIVQTSRPMLSANRPITSVVQQALTTNRPVVSANQPALASSQPAYITRPTPANEHTVSHQSMSTNVTNMSGSQPIVSIKQPVLSAKQPLASLSSPIKSHSSHVILPASALKQMQQHKTSVTVSKPNLQPKETKPVIQTGVNYNQTTPTKIQKREVVAPPSQVRPITPKKQIPDYIKQVLPQSAKSQVNIPSVSAKIPQAIAPNPGPVKIAQQPKSAQLQTGQVLNIGGQNIGIANNISGQNVGLVGGQNISLTANVGGQNINLGGQQPKLVLMSVGGQLLTQQGIPVTISQGILRPVQSSLTLTPQQIILPQQNSTVTTTSQVSVAQNNIKTSPAAVLNIQQPQIQLMSQQNIGLSPQMSVKNKPVISQPSAVLSSQIATNRVTGSNAGVATNRVVASQSSVVTNRVVASQASVATNRVAASQQSNVLPQPILAVGPVISQPAISQHILTPNPVGSQHIITSKPAHPQLIQAAKQQTPAAVTQQLLNPRSQQTPAVVPQPLLNPQQQLSQQALQQLVAVRPAAAQQLTSQSAAVLMQPSVTMAQAVGGAKQVLIMSPPGNILPQQNIVVAASTGLVGNLQVKK